MLSALVINKIVSIYIGPSGIALIGQFQNLIQMSNTFSQGGVLSGVTKYTAEYNKHTPERLDLLWMTTFRIIIILSLICGFVLIFFSHYLSIYLFSNVQYYQYIRLLGGVTIFTSLNSYVLAILNGLKKIKLYVVINIYQSIVSLFLSSFLVIYLGLDGAFLALVLNQSVIFITLVFTFYRYDIFSRLKGWCNNYSSVEAKKLFAFSLMAITSAIVGPLSLMLIRYFIQENIGINASGYWQSMWYISSMYLLVVTTTLSIYYLPRLSELSNNEEIKKELFSGLKIIIPLVSIASFLVFCLRDYIISILFTHEFYEMRYLFKWQVCGDVLKITAWLFSYILIARAESKVFILLEIVNFSFFALLSIVMIHLYGLIGGSFGYFISNFIYLLLVASVVYYRFLKAK